MKRADLGSRAPNWNQLRKKKSLLTLAPRVYRLIHRMFPCSYCAAVPRQRCVGANQLPIEEVHLLRKQASREYRKEFPEQYRAMREKIAAEVFAEMKDAQ